MKRIFKCITCDLIFSPDYRLSKKKKLSFCSKSCKSKFQRQGYFNKTQLENAIKKLIKIEGKYLTKQDILTKLKISSKTLSKFRVSILSLNRELNMKKPSSIFENIVGLVLKETYKDIKSQITFKDCLSPKGYLLKFDFYIPSKKLLVEADGDQHNNLSHYYSNVYTIECDNIKNKYAAENNLKLVRIPYNRKTTKEYVLQFIID